MMASLAMEAGQLAPPLVAAALAVGVFEKSLRYLEKGLTEIRANLSAGDKTQADTAAEYTRLWRKYHNVPEPASWEADYAGMMAKVAERRGQEPKKLLWEKQADYEQRMDKWRSDLHSDEMRAADVKKMGAQWGDQQGANAMMALRQDYLDKALPAITAAGVKGLAHGMDAELREYGRVHAEADEANRAERQLQLQVATGRGDLQHAYAAELGEYARVHDAAAAGDARDRESRNAELGKFSDPSSRWESIQSALLQRGTKDDAQRRMADDIASILRTGIIIRG
jgi:hypothetical protein